MQDNSVIFLRSRSKAVRGCLQQVCEEESAPPVRSRNRREWSGPSGPQTAGRSPASLPSGENSCRSLCTRCLWRAAWRNRFFCRFRHANKSYLRSRSSALNRHRPHWLRCLTRNLSMLRDCLSIRASRNLIFRELNDTSAVSSETAKRQVMSRARQATTLFNFAKLMRLVCRALPVYVRAESIRFASCDLAELCAWCREHAR